MMEKIDITTRFKADGSLIPVEFSTGAGQVKVLDVGRQWETDQGKHLLVMDAARNTYHLLFQVSDLCWYWVKDIKPGPNRT
jgi:hypothetical protein